MCKKFVKAVALVLDGYFEGTQLVGLAAAGVGGRGFAAGGGGGWAATGCDLAVTKELRDCGLTTHEPPKRLQFFMHNRF